MRSLEEIYSEKKSFPFQVVCTTSKATRPLKIFIVGKRDNGKFDSLVSRRSQSHRAGWSVDKKIWRAL